MTEEEFLSPEGGESAEFIAAVAVEAKSIGIFKAEILIDS